MRRISSVYLSAENAPCEIVAMGGLSQKNYLTATDPVMTEDLFTTDLMPRSSTNEGDPNWPKTSIDAKCNI